MEAQFTPAPWTIWQTARYVEVLAPEDHGQPIVKWVGFAQSLRPFDEQLANAKLIATAPDMLRLLVRYRNETPLGHQPHMIAAEADALIEKARGQDREDLNP